jgi:Protein of unknown function (DUF2459)
MVLLCGPQAGAAIADASSTIYVVRRGWHIDIGLSAQELGPRLDAIGRDLPDARTLFFGFADRHYLLAKHRNAPVLLGALWPGAGIILVTGIAGGADAAFGAPHVITLSVDSQQMEALRAFIWSSLVIQDESVNVYRNGPYEDSLYFLATPKYSGLHTCNTWGAEALRSAGFRVHSRGVIFAGQLWAQARRLKRQQRTTSD